MPRMHDFLGSNGPWDQLVELGNIQLHSMKADSAMQWTPRLKISPFLVPHRDEYSETVGFLLEGPEKSLLYIPDIDKWKKWDQSIIELIRKSDYALLDATFYDERELSHGRMEDIPHPFVLESMALFDSLSATDRKKIFFIHLNHTNPLLNENSEEYRLVLEKGYNVATYLQLFSL